MILIKNVVKMVPKWSPAPSPSPASVKVPFRGEKYKKNKFLNKFFRDFLNPPIPIPGVSQGPLPGEKYRKVYFYGFFMIYGKLKNGTKKITPCSIRRVGRR